MLNITDDYDGFTNSKQTIYDKNDKVNIILRNFLLSVADGPLLTSNIGFIIWRTLKPLFS